ncbi:glycosyltransferase family 4 protein [bacterium]|nr:glycosyltransferase family 4 protein [candidate division CSSED10-310 bacterium]
MRIAVVGASPVPFCRGGIENFMAGLYRAINDHTEHSAELIKIPVREHTVTDLLAAYHRLYRTRLDHFDLVISTKYPAWNIRHRNHIIYLGHRLRGLYDTYPIAAADDALWKWSPFSFPGPWIRRIIHRLDNRAIRPETISYAFCTSRTIAARAEYFHPELPPEVVYHGTVRDDYEWKPGEYLFTVNRLDGPKRVDLMIRAFRQVDTDLPFLIAGSGPHLPVLRALAAGDDRIQFLGDVSEDTLRDLYARAVAVMYTPYREDYGLITIEAMKSGKPVICTTDSGGPLEFVRHGENGWIASPDPEALAGCIREMLMRRESLAAMADCARDTVRDITWRHVVDTLLRPYRYWPSRGPGIHGDRRRITVLAPYPVFPPRSGGQCRVAGICRELAGVYDVTILSLDRTPSTGDAWEIEPHLKEIRIPPSQLHARKQWHLEQAVGETVSDVALPRLLRDSPNYIRAVQHFAECSDIFICEQPFLFRFIPTRSRVRLVALSSQNIEHLLKRPILSGSRAGRRLLHDTYQAEKRAVHQADIVFATSADEGRGLMHHYGRRSADFAVAPNGVDTGSVRPASDAVRANARHQLNIPETATACLFIGAWHPPNLEALCFIRDTVAPAFPGDRFLVIGSVREHYRHQIGDPADLPPNMVLLGEVPEAEKDAALHAADIALNPMISGGGTNLKILEYAAAGIPCITTPTGIRGLALIPNRDVLVASTQDFTSALLRLKQDPDLRRQLAISARTTVVSTYDWQTIGQGMIRELESRFPVTGSLSVDFSAAAPFGTGWYAPEQWEDAGYSSPGTVRWTSDIADCRLAAPRKQAILHLLLHTARPGQPVRVVADGSVRADHVFEPGWHAINLSWDPKPGVDDVHLLFVTRSWTPSDSGSADTRSLGIAFSRIEFLSESSNLETFGASD